MKTLLFTGIAALAWRLCAPFVSSALASEETVRLYFDFVGHFGIKHAHTGGKDLRFMAQILGQRIDEGDSRSSPERA